MIPSVVGETSQTLSATRDLVSAARVQKAKVVREAEGHQAC